MNVTDRWTDGCRDAAQLHRLHYTQHHMATTENAFLIQTETD